MQSRRSILTNLLAIPAALMTKWRTSVPYRHPVQPTRGGNLRVTEVDLATNTTTLEPAPSRTDILKPFDEIPLGTSMYANGMMYHRLPEGVKLPGLERKES